MSAERDGVERAEGEPDERRDERIGVYGQMHRQRSDDGTTQAGGLGGPDTSRAIFERNNVSRNHGPTSPESLDRPEIRSG